MADVRLAEDVHPDHDLWFDDGNVVIEAENTAFKLYRGMISRQSTVFRDILDGKKHNGLGAEVLHKNALIRVSDSASDLRIMFLGITDPNFFQGPPHKYEGSIVLSIASTSHKYGIAALYQRSIAHLTTALPVTLSEFDTRGSRTTLLRSEELNSSSQPAIANESVQLFSTVFSIETPWLRPAALYSTCQIPLSIILHTPTWRDSTSMTEETRTTLLIAHGTQRQMNSTAFKFLRYLPDEQCLTPIACNKVCKNWIGEESIWTDGRPLMKLEDKSKYKQHLEGLCGACKRKCLRISQKSRESIWDDLPAKFRLGTWDSLLAQRDEYLASVESPQRTSNETSRSGTRGRGGHQVLDGQG